MKTPAAARVHAERVELWLIECGWWMSDAGFHHKNLNGGRWPWPMGHAARLQREADEGGKEPAHQILRGER